MYGREVMDSSVSLSCLSSINVPPLSLGKTMSAKAGGDFAREHHLQATLTLNAPKNAIDIVVAPILDKGKDPAMISRIVVAWPGRLSPQEVYLCDLSGIRNVAVPDSHTRCLAIVRVDSHVSLFGNWNDVPQDVKSFVQRIGRLEILDKS